MQLLKNTNQRIPDIADNIGYKSTSSFYNAFKKRFGLTPRMVRKKA
ncbi:helix-turn-helix domain-containing protein [Galbibacter sp.]